MYNAGELSLTGIKLGVFAATIIIGWKSISSIVSNTEDMKSVIIFSYIQYAYIYCVKPSTDHDLHIKANLTWNVCLNGECLHEE